MLVSIITPMHNAARYIGQAIESVQAQDFADWEMIIVDDCSVDDSVAVVERYMSLDPRIKIFLSEVNLGAACARNKAIAEARGRFIAFLDSDDLWLPHKLSVQIDFMLKKHVLFCYSAYKKISESGVVVSEVGVPAKVDYQGLLKTCVIGCLTAVYDSGALGKVYMPEIRKRQDFGLWLRLLKSIEFAEGIQEPLALHRIRAGSISSNKISAAKYTWMLYYKVERLGLMASIYYFSNYACRGFLRKNFPAVSKKLGVMD